MRRRQATNNAGNGIVLLEATSENDKKYKRRHTRGCSNSFISFGLIGLAAVYLILNKETPAPLTTLDGLFNASNSSKSSSITSGNQSSAAIVLSTYDPPRIPRRLIFTYKYNLIAPAPNDPPFNYKEPMTANVLNTIEKYQTYWDDIDKSSNMTNNEDLVVSFLSDNGCREVITKAEPRLMDHFNTEKRGEFKADICRVAELYIYGGYYFDIDLGVIHATQLDEMTLPSKSPDPIWNIQLIKNGKLSRPQKDDIVTFATVANGQGRFFQAFTAATPKHICLKRALDYMVAYYEGTLGSVLPPFILKSMKEMNHKIPSRESSGGMGVGPFTMSAAHRSTTDQEWEDYAKQLMKEHGYVSKTKQTSVHVPAKTRYARFMYEISLENEELKKQALWTHVHVPLLDANYTKKVQWCNFVCFSGDKVFFYSRVQGSKGCPEEKRIKRV